MVIDELERKENRYIRLLTRKLDIREEITGLVKEYGKKYKDSRYEILMDAVISTNLLQFMEVYEMTKKLSEEELEAINRVIKKFDIGEKIREEGKIEGEVNLLIRVLNKKLGKMPEDIKKQLEGLKCTDTVENIMDNIFEINCINDIKRYL